MQERSLPSIIAPPPRARGKILNSRPILIAVSNPPTPHTVDKERIRYKVIDMNLQLDRNLEKFLEGKGPLSKKSLEEQKAIQAVISHLLSVPDIFSLYGYKNFHRLKGNREGQYSIRLPSSRRIVIEQISENPEVWGVKVIDYHRG